MNLKFNILTIIMVAMLLPFIGSSQNLTPYGYIPNGARRSKVPPGTVATVGGVGYQFAWATTGNYELYDSVAGTWGVNSGAIGANSKLVIVQAPDTAIFAASQSYPLLGLRVDTGAAILGKGSAQSASSSIRMGAGIVTLSPGLNDSTILVNNGTIGLPMLGFGNYIDFSFTRDSIMYKFTGSGKYYFTRLRPNVKLSRQKVIFDADMDYTYKGVAFSAFQNNAGYNAGFDSIAFTINPGKTIRVTDSSSFHMAGNIGSIKGGKYIYNVNGTLDLSSSRVMSYFVPADDSLGSSITSLNIAGGILNLPKGMVVGDPSATKGKVQIRVSANGVVNGFTDTALIMRANSLFVLSDSSASFRRISAAVDTTYPIGTADTVNNTVKITNTGAIDTISIGLKNTITDAWPAASLPRLIKKTWRVTESTVGGSNLSMKFAYVTDDKGVSFTGTAIQGYVFTGLRWKRYNATLTGAGTVANPYVAAFSGVDSFQRIVIGDSGLVVPAPVTSFVSTMTGFQQILGTPSPIQSFTLSAASLIGNVTLTVPANHYQIATDTTAATSNWATTLTIPQGSGLISALPIYVRLNAPTLGTYNDSVTITTLVANPLKVPLNGVTVAVPVLTQVSAFTPFQQIVGTASASQTFTVSGVNLLGRVLVTAPANYQVATSATGVWQTVDTLNPVNGVLTATTIYIRLNAGAVGTYADTVRVTSASAATIKIPLTGTTVAVPVITAVSAMAPFVQPLGGYSDPQSFTVSGAGLMGKVYIAAPAGFLISLDTTTGNASYHAADSISQGTGTLATKTVFVKMFAPALGAASGNIVLTSVNAVTVNIPVSGSTVNVGIKNVYNSNQIVVYPNPITNNRFMIKINGVEAGEYTISVTNIMGQKVATQVLNYTGNANNEYSVALPSSLPAGSYQLNVSGAKVSINTKISVQ